MCDVAELSGLLFYVFGAMRMRIPMTTRMSRSGAANCSTTLKVESQNILKAMPMQARSRSFPDVGSEASSGHNLTVEALHLQLILMAEA